MYPTLRQGNEEYWKSGGVTRKIGEIRFLVANYYTNIVFACYLCCITQQQYKL